MERDDSRVGEISVEGVGMKFGIGGERVAVEEAGEAGVELERIAGIVKYKLFSGVSQ